MNKSKKISSDAVYKIIIFAVLTSFISQAAIAGPIRDLLIERESAQQSSESLDNSESSYSAISLPKGVKVLHDIPYGNDSRQRFDVYVPHNAKDAPAIFMVHGGAWSLGDKASSTVVKNKVARWVPRGFIFISANYRLLPKSDPLQQAEDVARALAAAQAQAKSWGGNPSKFILMGHSAGAHLVDLLAASPSKALGLGARLWLGTVSLDSAALDVVPIMEAKHYRFYDRAFGKDVTYWKLASPFQVLSAGATPMLMVCSTARSDVASCPQAKSFAVKAASLGVRVEVLEEPLSHKQINDNIGVAGAYTDAVETFMGSLDSSVMKALTNH